MFNFAQKMNEKIQTNDYDMIRSNSFSSIFGRIEDFKKTFRN